MNCCIKAMAVLCVFSGVGAGVAETAAPHPWTHLNFQNDPDCFQFAIVPDRTGGDYRGAFTNALEKVNRMHPEFVMTVGDLVEGMNMQHVNSRRTITEVQREQKAELEKMTSKVVAPFFTVVGNHDIGRSRPYPPCFAHANEESSAVWKEFHGGETYYSFVYKRVLFVCLNTMEGRGAGRKQEGITARQYAWFKKTLDDNADVRWTCVFMHQPGEWLTDAWLKFEKEELAKRKYTVFAGDWHTYVHAKRHGRDYYVFSVAGGGSCMNATASNEMRSRLKGPAYGEMDHIVWVTMTPNGPDVMNLLLEGMLPGDYLNQKTTLNEKYADVLDYPADQETTKRLSELRLRKEAAAVNTVKASSFGWNAEDSTAALQAAIDSGARKVVVDWRDEGDWVVSPVVLRSSNQEIAIADGVTLRGRRNSGSDAAALLTIPEGVTNVFLRGIVTAAIAIDDSGCRHALDVCGGENVTVCDLTVVSDNDEWIKTSGKEKGLKIGSIIRKKTADWPKRQ